MFSARPFALVRLIMADRAAMYASTESFAVPLLETVFFPTLWASEKNASPS